MVNYNFMGFINEMKMIYWWKFFNFYFIYLIFNLRLFYNVNIILLFIYIFLIYEEKYS